MPFHFKKTETPAKAVRRLSREHVRAARKCLERCDRPASVHGARKEIKKLRATLRLVRDEIGRDDYRKVAKSLRRAADNLALPRDAWVALKAFERLTTGSGSRFVAVRKALQEHCCGEARRFQKDDAMERSRKRLKKTSRRVSGLKIKAPGWKAIEPGLRRSYQLGRSACELAQRAPSPEHFHDWRKHVKNLWYQLRFLCPAWPASVCDVIQKLEVLGEVLGEDHDLYLLTQFLEKFRAGKAGEFEALKQLIEARRQKLGANVLKLGRTIYRETPVHICRRLGKHWRSWHEQTRRK